MRKEHASSPPDMNRGEARKHTKAIIDKLAEFQFTHFVTLTFSNANAGRMYTMGSSLPGDYIRGRLKQWDAHICRLLLGPNWQQKAPDRPLFAAFLEKPDTNPHYHLLLKFQPSPRRTIKEQQELFAADAARLWRKLVPGGTVDIKPISTPFSVARYVLKTYGYNLRYECIVWPDELVRQSSVQEMLDIAEEGERRAKINPSRPDKHVDKILQTIRHYRGRQKP